MATAPRRIQAKPACTHLSMVKVFGTDDRCHLCQRVPPIGFIYVCDQRSEPSAAAAFDQTISAPLAKGSNKLQKSKHRRSVDKAPVSSLSVSIQEAIAAGRYTEEQVDVLRRQKKNVQETIKKSLELHKSSSKPTGLPSKKTTESSAYRQSIISELAIAQAIASRSLQSCDFKSCHTCRPFSQARTFISFEQVFAGEIAPPEVWDPATMPLVNSDVMRDIRLPGDRPFQAPFRFSDDQEGRAQGFYANRRPSVIFEAPEEDDLDVLSQTDSSSSRLQSHANNEGAFRASLRRSLFDMLHQICQSVEESERDGLANHMDQIRSLCRSHEDFEVELWHVMSEELLHVAARTPLPDHYGMDLDLIERPAAVQRHTEDSQEEHVAGGIALTEEAMETRSPDLITAV